ncbi:hypothetical protein SPH9361_00812 [Sphingobium sp. CECT 9361]|nr:hypothetical protein SPH9361_00812 [Sphingobium sp. CECT 9361]
MVQVAILAARLLTTRRLRISSQPGEMDSCLRGDD